MNQILPLQSVHKFILKLLKITVILLLPGNKSQPF